MTIIVSDFPGTGKTFLARVSNLAVADSDSSTFSRLPDGSRNPEFPANYIEHILSLKGKMDVVLVSTHAEVRSALTEAGIAFHLVIPAVELKDEYLHRYKRRGSPQAFIDLVASKWDEWIADCYGFAHKVG